MTLNAPLTTTPLRSPINWRSVSLGLLGTIIVCGVTPFNDYAVNNTYFVGNNLPLGLVVLAFLFAIFVNGPLNRWFPRYAMSSGEIAVAFSMTLVSCTLPSSGLMRYLPTSLVSPMWHARSDPQYLALLERLDLPEWIFPKFRGHSPREWVRDPIVNDYLGRWTGDGAPPYAAWIRPALVWGLFLAALYGALMCMVALVRHQWSENERLPFPLTQIQLALIEQPPPGRWLNGVLGKSLFWIGFLGPFLIRLWNGAAVYWPKYFDAIPMQYDFTKTFTEAPLAYLDSPALAARVYFIAIGVTFFLSTSIAFSLWFFFVLSQVYRVIAGSYTGDPGMPGLVDQHFGGIVAFAMVIAWVGRRHWRMIVAQAFRGPREGEEGGRYLSNRLAFWGLVGCTIGMIAWLVVAGCTLIGATVMIFLLMLLFFVATRIIAEAGLVHIELNVPLYKPWQLLATYGYTTPVPAKTFYFNALLQAVHFSFREAMPVYASHGLKLADQAVCDDRSSERDTAQQRSFGRRFILLLGLALLIGYAVSFASTLWTEYRYASTMDMQPATPINVWGAQHEPKMLILDPTVQYETSNYPTQHSPLGNWLAGFGIVSALGLLRLRYAWWPLHPIGYLLLATYPGVMLWLSIFIGWLLKVCTLRFGGPKMYLDAKPLFIGLIVGESAAAGFWLIVGIVLSLLGVPYHAIMFMPG